MRKIENSRKYQNGIKVFWTEEEKEFADFFPIVEVKSFPEIHRFGRPPITRFGSG